MIPKTPWTSRTFNFDFPVSHFPFIYARLMGTPARIEDLIKNLPESELEYKQGEKWSVKEHIGHLIDLEELHEGRLDDYNNKSSILRAADMSNKKTYEANHNEQPVFKLLNDLRKARTLFLSQLKNKSESELIQTSIHPRLQKPMRLVDMTYFVAEHDDQHVTCIMEIIQSPR